MRVRRPGAGDRRQEEGRRRMRRRPEEKALGLVRRALPRECHSAYPKRVVEKVPIVRDC
jgi:hypothetical protein